MDLSGKEKMEIRLTLEMEAVLMQAHSYVEEDSGQAAVQRGPLVYCMESADMGDVPLSQVYLPADVKLAPVSMTIEGQSLVALEGTGERIQYASHTPGALYEPLCVKGFSKIPVRLIPCFAWDNPGLWRNADFPAGTL